MCYAYHLAGNAFILIVLYLLVYMFVSPSSKLNHHQIEDEEQINEYKLIIDENDEDNGL